MVSPRPAVTPGRRGPSAARRGQRDAPGRTGNPPTNLAGSDEIRSWIPGKPRINVPDMAIATRRLQASLAPPVVPGERSGGGVRRARLEGAGSPGADSRDAQRRLMEAAVEAGDVAATVDAVAQLTRSPAALQDPFLAVLASAPASAAGAIALTRSGCPLVRDLLRAGAARPALVELPRAGSTPARLVARVTARGELLGFLVVAAVDRAAYATLEAAAPVLALLLQAEERLCRLLDRDQRELFLDLLAGRSADCLVLQGRRLLEYSREGLPH